MDSKRSFEEVPIPQPTRRRSLKKHVGLIAISLIAAGLLFFQPSNLSLPGRRLGESRPAAEDGPFDWSSITPSEKILWSDCSKVHKCARLLLPLDYFTPKGPKTTIALRMIPAPNGPFGKNTTTYKGPIFINPGGPGGSGTKAVEVFGGAISTIVGPDFDIFGFDPRGTGSSYPVASCFESEAQFGVWSAAIEDQMKVGDGSIPMALARKEVVDELCLKALGGKNGTESLDASVEEWGGGRFMTSASVATDMVRMMELLGQEKLQYWGFSYGSILGQYFAAMYPEKLGHVVIDGIADAESYRSDTWAEVTPDIEIIFDTFFTLCAKAGPEKCPLYAPKAEDIRKRVYGIIDKLEKNPIPIPFAKKGPILLTGTMLRMKMFSATYAPLRTFYDLAEDFIAIENNNQTRLAESVDEVGFKCDCRSPDLPIAPLASEALQAISCTDADPFTEDESDIKKFLETKSKVSPLFARVWAQLRLICNDWPIRPKWRFTKPFTLPSNFSLSATSSSNVSPILILSTRYDPVCPLYHARSVHKRLGSANSRLIIQESTGHCSINSPSVCTALWVRAYFNGGKVPDEGEKVRCPVKELPFIGKVEDGDEGFVGERDGELESALEKLAEADFGMKLI